MEQEDILKAQDLIERINKYESIELTDDDWLVVHRLSNSNINVAKEVFGQLIEQKVLSLVLDGNYTIMDSGMCHNLSNGHFLYFTREKDAKKYRDLTHKGLTIHKN